jgi:hypothetical protein
MMDTYGADRFQEPSDAPVLPKRIGTFEIEEAWLGIEVGKFKFYTKPGFAPVAVQLKYEYIIGRGEREPNIERIFWRADGEAFWQEITCEYEIAHLYVAAELFLDDKEVAPLLGCWINDNEDDDAKRASDAAVARKAMVARQLMMGAA